MKFNSIKWPAIGVVVGVCLIVGVQMVSVLGQVDSPLYRNTFSDLVVTTIDGAQVTFQVVTVNTDADRRQGLMHVNFMPLDQGMVFQFPGERVRSMWMKNTLISLDMWFVTNDGTIAHIERNTTPHSLDSLSSKVSVVAVVEINGGLSTLLGVTEGASLDHSLFKVSD